MTYNVISADPPWQQSKGGRKAVRQNSSGASLDYSVMPLEQIQQHLSAASELAAPNSVLFLWTIDKYLHMAETLVRPLGYKLHARMVWNKVTGIPAAFTVRYGHEYLLYMYRGKLVPVAKSQRGKWHSVFTERVRRHSEKPEISYQLIESLYPAARRLELYARRPRRGWDVWGNEVNSDVSLVT